MPTPLTLKLRKALPEPLRRLARVWKYLLSDKHLSPLVPQHLLDGCRFLATRGELLDWLPKGGVIAEIGTLRGEFAGHVLRLSRPRELHVVDLDFSQFDADLDTNPALHRHAGDSVATLSTFPDRYFDWIFIDADHSYRGVARDIAAAAPKVKPGGFLVFDDYGHIDPWLGVYGVHRAVTEFAVSRNWEFACFVFSPSALYGLALRKPENAG